MTRSAAHGPVPPANRLLAALPRREYDRLHPCLEPVPLAFKAVLCQSGCPMDYVHFPAGGVISLISPTEERSEGIEVGLVGREGMAGLPIFLGVQATPFRYVVQVPGDALRMRIEDFRARVSRAGTLHEVLLRYTHAFMTQLSHSVACNSLHPVENRLCRWLLAVHDRAATDRFPLTHDFLAAMLGVRRASVTDAAGRLREAGLIRYGRGQLTVLDRAGLHAGACRCYHLIQDEMERVLR